MESNGCIWTRKRNIIGVISMTSSSKNIKQDKSNIINFDCGCAIEYDGQWRGCYKHWHAVFERLDNDKLGKV